MCGHLERAERKESLLDFSHGEPYIEFLMGDKERRFITKLKCLRCGYSWWPRVAGQPIRCASCRTPYWNTPPGQDGRRHEGR